MSYKEDTSITDDMIAEADPEIMKFSQPQKKALSEYAELFWP